MFDERRPPTSCRRGHPLGPRQVTVSWTPCTCERATAGHLYWRCNTCADIQYADDHTEDSKIPAANPSPR